MHAPPVMLRAGLAGTGLPLHHGMPALLDCGPALAYELAMLGRTEWWSAEPLQRIACDAAGVIGCRWR